MSEEERLEFEASRLRGELKELNMKKAMGQLENDDIIKEKKRELFKVLTDLELSKMVIKNEGRRR